MKVLKKLNLVQLNVEEVDLVVGQKVVVEVLRRLEVLAQVDHEAEVVVEVELRVLIKNVLKVLADLVIEDAMKMELKK